jgi:hypothetical protein
MILPVSNSHRLCQVLHVSAGSCSPLQNNLLCCLLMICYTKACLEGIAFCDENWTRPSPTRNNYSTRHCPAMCSFGPSLTRHRRPATATAAVGAGGSISLYPRPCSCDSSTRYVGGMENMLASLTTQGGPKSLRFYAVFG